ncbi:hypothetical protein L1887_43890 [Cichorium endivia]|nr:hypothetical protein L1887_43890 [Cichorium endivia]
MGYLVSVVRHPQHGNILLPGIAMNNLVDVALVADQRDPLLFSARQRSDGFGQRLLRQAKAGQIVEKLFRLRRFIADLPRENQVVINRVAKKRGRLYAVGGLLAVAFRGKRCDILSFKQNGALRRAEK